MQPQTMVQATESATNALKDFEQFVFSYGNGWTLINRQTDLLTYQKSEQANKGSCLVAGILFLIMILPGILYLYFSHKAPVIHQLMVRMDEQGNLTASGDPEGMVMYSKFLNRNKPSTLSQVVAKVMPKK